MECKFSVITGFFLLHSTIIFKNNWLTKQNQNSVYAEKRDIFNTKSLVEDENESTRQGMPRKEREPKRMCDVNPKTKKLKHQTTSNLCHKRINKTTHQHKTTK